jgi:hypothetical protein
MCCYITLLYYNINSVNVKKNLCAQKNKLIERFFSFQVRQISVIHLNKSSKSTEK